MPICVCEGCRLVVQKGRSVCDRYFPRAANSQTGGPQVCPGFVR